MKKIVELPLVSPVYSTYHYQGSGGAIIAANPSIRNWYLSEALILSCTRSFFAGCTTPELEIEEAKWRENPNFEVYEIPLRFLRGSMNSCIRNLIDEGYYVIFEGIDDYYVEGKSWYRELHFFHDGAICGYNQEDKTYCIYAYDSNWVYRKFWTSQKGFEDGRKYMFDIGRYGVIYGIKPKTEKVEFSSASACEKITRYLDSRMEDHIDDVWGRAYGISVQEYLVAYLDKLLKGEIPYQRMDRRIFRLIWEHKKAMCEAIKLIETELKLDFETSEHYKDFIDQANEMRMLYASYHKRRRDTILPVIQKKLLALRWDEQKLLETFLDKVKGTREK